MKIYLILKELVENLNQTVEVRSIDKVRPDIRCYLDVNTYTTKEAGSVYFYVDEDNICKLHGRYKILSDDFEDDIKEHNTPKLFNEYISTLFTR
jgi:hypothetical protein